MKIVASEDTKVGEKLVRRFTVVAKKTNGHHLKVHTKYGVTDAQVLLEAGEMFSDLGKVHHVAPTHHREWNVWVEVGA